MLESIKKLISTHRNNLTHPKDGNFETNLSIKELESFFYCEKRNISRDYILRGHAGLLGTTVNFPEGEFNLDWLGSTLRFCRNAAIITELNFDYLNCVKDIEAKLFYSDSEYLDIHVKDNTSTLCFCFAPKKDDEIYCKGCECIEKGSCPFSNSAECQEHHINNNN